MPTLSKNQRLIFCKWQWHISVSTTNLIAAISLLNATGINMFMFYSHLKFKSWRDFNSMNANSRSRLIWENCTPTWALTKPHVSTLKTMISRFPFSYGKKRERKTPKYRDQLFLSGRTRDLTYKQYKSVTQQKCRQIDTQSAKYIKYQSLLAPRLHD